MHCVDKIGILNQIANARYRLNPVIGQGDDNAVENRRRHIDD